MQAIRLTAEVRPPRRPRFASAKFTRPDPGPELVPRPAVFAKLQTGRDRRLTVVVGAPGMGKTTAVAGGLAGRTEVPRPSVAWLTCDDGDRSPSRFLGALIEAMSRGFDAPDLGVEALELLDLDGMVSVDVLAALGDALEELPEARRVLVLDDFHLLAGPSEGVLGDFLECRPASLQVVVISRQAPDLRLHRMRAHQELVEIDEADLAFTLDETRALLTSFDLPTTASDIESVHERMEGWPAGIQLAAICAKASGDETGTLPDVGAETIAGYFLDEVLVRQPDEVVDFMLATSVLDELSRPACIALCGERAPELLDHLCASHLFVTKADERRGTFRYHQLVKEVLATELRRRDAGRELALHTTASEHLRESGQATQAAWHLVQAGELGQAFALLSDGLPRDLLTQPATTSAFDTDDCRPELFAGAPEILVPLAAAMLWRGPFEGGVRALELAERCAIDPAEDPELALRLAAAKTVHHAMVGELDRALRERDVVRSLAANASGVSDWVVATETTAMFCLARLGESDAARRLGRDLVADAAGLAHVELCEGVLSQVAVLEGDLDEAGASAERSLEVARRLGFDRHFFALQPLFTAGEVALERRDLDAATDAAERALAIADRTRPVFSFVAQLLRARIWAADGRHDAALASLPAARASLGSHRAVILAEADDLEARLRLSLGDVKGARGLVRRVPDRRRWVLEAMIALAAGDTSAAERALSLAPTPAPTTRTNLELRLLRANVALAASGADAPSQVRDALDVARAKGFVQTVLDTAPQLVDHVEANPDAYPPTEHLTRLVAARLETEKDARRRATPSAALTDAEVRVLRSLADRHSYADIAAQLYVSTNTVKTHLRHAYSKLGVSSRTAAIARASALGLL